MITCRGHRPCSAQVYAFVPTTFGGSGRGQAGGVGDDTVHVEDDRRERRVRRWGAGGVRRGVGHCLADAAV